MKKLLPPLLMLFALSALGAVIWHLAEPAPEARRPAPASYSRGGGNRVTAAASAGLARAEETAPARPAVEPGAGAAPAPLCDEVHARGQGPKVTLPAWRSYRSEPPQAPGAWTWVNLWAAWCKPCIAEMPSILAWAEAQRSAGAPLRLVFLSLDDDERELQRFFQPGAKGANLVGAEFGWLRGEAERAAFARGLGLEHPPSLPVQILLDPDGRLRCLRVGGVEPADLERIPRELGLGQRRPAAP